MDVAAVIVAIVAILLSAVLAGFGILIQLQTHKATTEQSERVADSVAQFRVDMGGLVGELKGMTHTLVEAQQQQFNRMLDAFVTRPGAAAEVAERTGESAESLQQISDAMEALKQEIRRAASADEVQHKLDELAGRLEAVSASTAQAARLAEAAAWDVGRAPAEAARLARVYVGPDTVARGQPVSITLLLYDPLRDPDYVTCAVGSPSGARWTSELTPAQLQSQAVPNFVFPDHFPGGSTEETGEYDVEVFVMARLRAARYHVRFRVVEPGAIVVE
jgi:hypothetical protein